MSDTLCQLQASIDKTAYNVVQLLVDKQLKISTAESCTGGLISAAVTAVGGASDVFDEGICTYSNSAKEKYLGVPHEVLETYGAVSEETARYMASGMLKAAGSDIAVSVTGIAGPTGGTKEKPVGTVYVGICTKERCEADLVYTNPDEAVGCDAREYIRKSTVLRALSRIEDELRKI